jgi:hypothetical protein
MKFLINVKQESFMQCIGKTMYLITIVTIAMLIAPDIAKAEEWPFTCYAQEKSGGEWSLRAYFKRIDPWPAHLANCCNITLAYTPYAIKVVSKNSEERVVLCKEVMSAYNKAMRERVIPKERP